jgi:acyl-coenzyme A thioesterase PaaI-like protein
MPEPGLSMDSFSFEDIPTAEVEAAEQRYGAFTDQVRRLLDLTIRSTVDEDRLARAEALIAEAADLLAEQAPPGPAGVHYNAEGRSWNWGNAVIGVRNAVAPPVSLVWAEDGTVSAEVTLGAPYEGPPGQVHGGVSAMLLDHLMGETASAGHTRLTVTGTLTLRYVRPLPLGPVRMSAEISEEAGRKVTVTARIGPVTGPGAGTDDAPAVEAHGLFIIPSWAYQSGGETGIGSLD